jgi:hypothetical protein
VNLPTTTSTVEELGIEIDSESNSAGIFHDGGGGATQNGYHVQAFADSLQIPRALTLSTTLWRSMDMYVSLTAAKDRGMLTRMTA